MRARSSSRRWAVWSSPMVEVKSGSGVGAGMVGCRNAGEALRRRGAEGHWPLEGRGGGSGSGGDLHVEKKRKERGMRGGRRLVVFWSINFKKLIKVVSSAMFRRAVKL